MQLGTLIRFPSCQFGQRKWRTSIYRCLDEPAAHRSTMDHIEDRVDAPLQCDKLFLE